MIAIHIDSMEDTARLKTVYEGIDCTLLYNPTRNDVVFELANNDDDTILLLGHGSRSGLFSKDLQEYVFDWRIAKEYCKDRKIIGIWCYASEFGDSMGLHGFFTSMFISNLGEALSLGFTKNTNEDILDEVTFFCLIINKFIKENTPMENWVSILQKVCHKEKDFVRFNYEALSYFE